MRAEHEGGTAAWAAVTQVAPSVKGHRLSSGRSYGPISCFSFPDPPVAGDQKASLASLSL